MDNIQGKHFSIPDPKGVKTVIYQVNKTEKEFLKEYPKYTVERLDHTEEIRGDFNKKTFYVENPSKDGNRLVILSFGEDKVVINTGILINDEVKITKKPTPFKFTTLYSEEGSEYKDELAAWGRVKPICYEIIKGKQLPVSFKIVLQLSKKNIEKFLNQTETGFRKEEVNGLFLNIYFDRK